MSANTHFGVKHLRRSVEHDVIPRTHRAGMQWVNGQWRWSSTSCIRKTPEVFTRNSVAILSRLTKHVQTFLAYLQDFWKSF